MDVPKGWVVPKIGRPLVIGVPNRVGYKEFVESSVDSNNRTAFRGFCIDVFQQALSNLPYAVSYYFTSFGDGNSTPSYDALVDEIAEKVKLISNACSSIAMCRLRIIYCTCWGVG